MSTIDAEIASQPDAWGRAAALAEEQAALLPAAGERVCIVGCGTSLHIASAWAELREAAGHGLTDAFPASELRDERRYDVLVALSRSGTTTEVMRALELPLAERSVAIVADPGTPVAQRADAYVALPFADEQAVVQTRFATAALTLLRAHVEPDATARAIADGEAALAAELPLDPAATEHWAFLGRGWTIGLAHEAALKLREAARAWTEAYPAMEYRHGPISVAGPASAVWSLGPLDPKLAEEVAATGATIVDPPLDPLAGLVLAQRCAVALSRSRGMDPDHPRHLSRSVVLEP